MWNTPPVGFYSKEHKAGMFKPIYITKGIWSNILTDVKLIVELEVI